MVLAGLPCVNHLKVSGTVFHVSSETAPPKSTLRRSICGILCLVMFGTHPKATEVLPSLWQSRFLWTKQPTSRVFFVDGGVRAGYGGVRRGTAGYRGVGQAMAGYGGVRRGTAGYGRGTGGVRAGYGRGTGGVRGTAGYGGVRQGTAGYRGVRRGTAGYGGVWRGTAG